MRNGFILLHRKGLTPDEWKHPLRTLAWIDLLTLAAWQDYTTDDGVPLRRGEMIASETFLAERWRQNRGTVHRWLKHWEDEGMVQRLVQHQSQQVPQRLFIVNYAKYQEVPQRLPQQVVQQVPQTMKRKEENEKNEKNTGDKLRDEITKHLSKNGIQNPRAYLAKLERESSWPSIEKAWKEWQRGSGVESPAEFYARAVHHSSTPLP